MLKRPGGVLALYSVQILSPSPIILTRSCPVLAGQTRFPNPLLASFSRPSRKLLLQFPRLHSAPSARISDNQRSESIDGKREQRDSTFYPKSTGLAANRHRERVELGCFTIPIAVASPLPLDSDLIYQGLSAFRLHHKSKCLFSSIEKARPDSG